MSPAPRWITISAASALGLGMLASGAVGVANAIPLVDSSTTAEVPPISNLPASATDDVKGSGDASFPVPASSPEVSSSAAPPAMQPAPAPQPVAPQPVAPVAPDSVSVASPDSIDSVD